MPVVGLPPAFVPPVVAVPAANSIVPFIAPAAASAAVAVGTVATAPLWLQLAVGAVAVGVTAAAVSQIWGTLARAFNAPPAYQPTTETAYTAGTVRPAGGGAGIFTVYWESPDVYPNVNTYTPNIQLAGLTVVRQFYEGMPWPGTTGTAVIVKGWDSGGAVVVNYALLVGAAPGYALWDGPTVPNLRLQSLRFFFNDGSGSVEVALAPVESSAPGRVLEPEAVPEPAKAPPIVVPLPYSPPAPAGDPLTEPAVQPSRQPRPVVAPPVVVPLPSGQPTPDAARSTTPSGQVQPAPLPPPRVTPTTVHVVNGTEIPGNGPQATPQGIAQELGRVEKKLARLIDPRSDGPGQAPDRLGWLRDNLGNILDFFLSITDGGEYEISSPCEVDGNGERIVKTVEYPGALQSFGVISNKIDALAALLQEHKDLKQPICRQTPATGGQPVTVNFVQTD